MGLGQISTKGSRVTFTESGTGYDSGRHSSMTVCEDHIGSITQLLENRTTFAIAHRLSTIRHADLIVVLEGGTILDQGTHDELMQSSDHYRDMVAAQTAKAERPVTSP